MSDQRAKIPRSNEDDYSPEIIAERQAFIEAQTGAKLNHTKQFSYDPHVMSGNIENIWGVSQIPIGIAGPLLVDGEYAKGEFFVPMATVEGTMLASSKSLWGTQPWCRAVWAFPISNDGAFSPAWLPGAFSPQFTAGTVWLESKASGEVVGSAGSPGFLGEIVECYGDGLLRQRKRLSGF
jgi:hypothetical protein